MDREEIMGMLLDNWNDPVVFVDGEHVIRYMNRPAEERWGEITGKSIFDCHNAASNDRIRKCFEQFQSGELDEIMISDSKRHRVYMRTVRDKDGKLQGYYERYEPPRG